MERETGFEPATSTLARSHSTAELLPLSPLIIANAPPSGNVTNPQGPFRMPWAGCQALSPRTPTPTDGCPPFTVACLHERDALQSPK
jgi:hypothetical protein